MNHRRLMGIAAYASMYICLFLAAPRAQGESVRPIFLLIGTLSFLGLNFLRDRLYPPDDMITRRALARPGSAIRKPWPSVYVCLGLIFLPLLVVLAIAESPGLPSVERIGQVIPFWAAIASASVLSWIRVPEGNHDRVFGWWVPAVLILLFGIAGARLMPNLLVLVVTGREVDVGTSGLPVILPVAVFAWRVYRFGKASPA
jgi:hypothetical protein